MTCKHDYRIAGVIKSAKSENRFVFQCWLCPTTTFVNVSKLEEFLLECAEALNLKTEGG